MSAVWPDAHMPVDAEGNIADVITDGDSIVKRMNVGSFYEQYVNATSRTVANELRAQLGGPSQAVMNAVRDGRLDFESQNQYMMQRDAQLQKLREMEEGKHTELLDACWARLMRYYDIISPRMHAKLKTAARSRKVAHLSSVVTDFCRIWMPTDNPVYMPEAIELLRREFPVTMGPVTYTGASGVAATTIAPVLIGSVYYITLEKTGGEFSAVASAKTQHIGILACLNKNDKYSNSVRPSAVRLGGESEIRAFVAFTSPYKTADLTDQSNNPRAHEAVIRTLLTADRPSDLQTAVDRNEIPLGDSRILEHVTEALFCAGIELYVPDHLDPAPPVYPPDIDTGDDDEDLRKDVEVDVDEEDEEIGDDDDRPRKRKVADEEEDELDESED